MSFKSEFSLFSGKGQRKYLNKKERTAFFQATKALPLEIQLFCRMLYFTGARLSEISDLHPQQIDFVDGMVIINTLKKRRPDVYRQIPLPDILLGPLLAFIDQIKLENHPSTRLWSFSTRTASRIIKRVMTKAGIQGVQACALGLRHGFAVHAVTKVPLTLVQKWMGHSNLKTTSIYLQISGIEEREWAEKMWDV